MTTLTREQYETLPTDQKRYWKDKSGINPNGHYKDQIRYTQVTIPLSEAERVINECYLPEDYPAGINYTLGWNEGLDEALTKLTQKR